MLHYMLDTNTVSYALRGKPAAVRARLDRVPMSQVCISAVTEAELRFGVALQPSATSLAQLIDRFLSSVTCAPWDSSAAKSFAVLATLSQQKGRRLAAMDLLIAAHAHSLGLTLVTSDDAFTALRLALVLENWSVSP